MLAEWGEEAAEDRDEYVAENIFWVPREARWARLKARARQPTIGQTVDEAMSAIERDNPALKGRASQGLRAARPGQAAPRPAHRHGRQHPRRRRRRSPLTGRAGAGLRVLPLAVRQRRGQEGAASSTRRAASSGFWSRCWSRTGAGSTIPAAAHRACSCSRWSSSALT